MKRTVEQAMKTMEAKRQEEKAKAKRKKVMKKPARAICDADADEMAESVDDAGGKDAEDGENEDLPPTPRPKSAPATKKVTPAHGKSGKGDYGCGSASKATPPKDKKPDKKTDKKPRKDKKPDKASASKKPDKKPIDISDLAVLTKKTMKETSRGCFTSKAYHAAR